MDKTGNLRLCGITSANLRKTDNTPLTAQDHADAMTDYVEQGVARAQALANRGPLTLGADGKLTPDILDAYHRTGFYVFENAVDSAEIELLRADMDSLLDRAPVDNGATQDHKAGQRLVRNSQNPFTLDSPPCGSLGGTKALNGRHPTQMAQPVADATAKKVVFLMFGMCQAMPSGLRLYGHGFVGRRGVHQWRRLCSL